MKNFLKKIKFLMPFIAIYSKTKILFFSFLNLPPKVKFSLYNGEEVFFNTRDWATANFCKNNIKGDILNYEPEQTKIFQDIIREKKIKTFFDAGSQIGYYSIIAAKLGVVEVYAFDIDANFSRIFKKQALLNNVLDKISFIETPIGEDDKTITIESFNKIIIKIAQSLDSFCEKINKWPDFIKMDIEGGELDALKNAQKILLKKPIILLALHPPFMPEKDKDVLRIFEIFSQNNYKIVSIGPLHKGELIDYRKYPPALFKEINDFICLPK